MVFIGLALAEVAIVIGCAFGVAIFGTMAEVCRGKLRPMGRVAFAIARACDNLEHECAGLIPEQYRVCVNRYKALTSAKSNTQTEKI